MARKQVSASQVLNTRKGTRDSLNEDAPRASWQLFMDFNELVIVEADSPIIENAGSQNAADPAIIVAERGEIRLQAGDGDGTAGQDGSQFCTVVPVQADSGNLAFECRVKIVDISEVSLYVGFTDITTLEEPMSVSGTTLTTNCSDGFGFIFDSAMTAPKWVCAGVDTNTDATGEGVSDATAPADGVYQTLRAEVNSLGTFAEFFVDGVKVHELTDKVCTPTVNMYFTVCLVGDGSNSTGEYAFVDYFLVSHDR